MAEARHLSKSLVEEEVVGVLTLPDFGATSLLSVTVSVTGLARSMRTVTDAI